MTGLLATVGAAFRGARGCHLPTGPRRLLVVSHPSVIAVNQAVYLRMLDDGWDTLLVVPNRWRHEYSSATFGPETLPGMEGRTCTLPVVLPGHPQRHVYLARPKRLIEQVRPTAVFLEQESFAGAAMQWGLAAHLCHVPFGVQSDENLDRVLPLPARAMRTWVLEHAGFIAARSPTAAAMVERWGAKGRIAVVPHALPEWSPLPRSGGGPFTVGFAGRLVPEKGIMDLVEAVQRVAGPVRLLLVGDGPLRANIERLRLANVTVDVRPGVPHARMPEAYAEMDVLVLPSRTTPTWAEQFGRVLVEALSCGVPIVGSDSGEIPWVVSTTGGGQVFPEGDAEQLGRILSEFRNKPAMRAAMGERGRAMVEKAFTAEACADAMTELLRS